MRNERLFTQVVRQILDLVARGELADGQKLPAERVLASTLGVSRASIRQALTALEVMGVIEVRHGSGIYVGSRSDPAVADMITAAPGPLEILEARLVAEPGVARIAAARRTDDDIEAIETLVEEMRTELAMGLDGWQPDWGFHEAVALATHNPSLSLLARSLREQMGQPLWALMRARNLRQGVHGRRYLEHHAAIAQAIAEGSGATAERLMRSHIRAVMTDLGVRREVDEKPGGASLRALPDLLMTDGGGPSD